MKNLGIKTKKFVRKITAIASAALMTGLSMGVAAADLSSLTSTFITSGQFDAYVALGTGGASNVVGFAKDVAGSIVVASAFAQQATTSTSTIGNATLERNITTGYLNSTTRAQSFELWNGKSVGKEWVEDDTGFSWLPNTTVSNATDVVANMTGKLSVSSTSGAIKTSDSGTVKVYNAAIVYNLTFADFASPMNGVGKNTTGITLPDGTTYKITGWTTDGTIERVTLGDFSEASAVIGTVYDIGSTGATFEITGHSADPSALKISVKDSAGTELYHDYVNAGDEIFANDDFTLNLVKYYTPGDVVDATIEWSTGVLTLEEGNASEGLTGGENWTFRVTTGAGVSATSNDTNNITSMAWEYRVPTGQSYAEVSPGSSIEFFGGFFNLGVDALDINSTDKTEATIFIKADNSDEELRMTDENGTAITFDISPKTSLTVDADFEVEFDWILGNSSTSTSYKITCDNDTPATFNLTRGTEVKAGIANDTAFMLSRTTEPNLPYVLHAIADMYGNTSANCVGMKFNITAMNITTDVGIPVNTNVSWVGAATTTNNPIDLTDGYFNISEDGLNRVVVQLDNGTIGSIDYYSGTTKYGDKIQSTGETYYTEYGTKVYRESSTEITVYYPDTTRVAKISIGRSGIKEYELAADDYNTELDITLKSAGGTSVSVNKIDVGLAQLDSEITSSTLDKPIILMGGWAVNSLVQELVDAGSINTTDLASDRALVQLVDSAFNSQSALVIAGWTGVDTRLAAQVVASQVLGTDMGLTGSKSILNTGFTSYSDVIVV